MRRTRARRHDRVPAPADRHSSRVASRSRADTFASELARARTFGFVHEVEALRAKGLIKGASLDNAVVLDDSGMLSGRRCAGPTSSCGTRRWTASATSRWRGRGCGRASSRAKPSHRGTVTLVRAMVKAGRKEKEMYTIEDIMKVLPHRYPFLLVDRILEIEEKKRIVGIKNVTINEPFFQGHFPGHPIMPGVLIIEAMAQVGGMLLMGSIDGSREQGRLLHVARQREVAAAGEAGRPDPLRARARPDARRDVQDARRRRRSTARSSLKPRWPRWCATDECAANPSDRDRRARRGDWRGRGDRRVRDRRRGLHDRRRMRDRAARDARAQRHPRRRSVKVGIGSVLGGDPQDLKFKGEETTVEIGDGTRDSRVRDDQSRHGALVQDDGREELLPHVVRAPRARLPHRRRRHHLERVRSSPDT